MPRERKAGKKKESKSSTKKEKVVKKEVCEIFDVEKNGEEETIKSCGVEEEKAPSEVQIKKESKIFKVIIITMIGFVLMFLGVLLLMSYLNQFSVGGVIFNIDKTAMTGKTLYRTSVPVAYKDSTTGRAISADYNFYFRTDPRILEKIPSSQDIQFRTNMVINMTEEFNCNGYGIIAVANLLNLYKVLGVNVIKDENATCDATGKYTYLNIKGANETSLISSGDTCYTINVKGCEILPATEKFMLETLIQADKKINQ
jgi:hypothetical protein